MNNKKILNELYNIRKLLQQLYPNSDIDSAPKWAKPLIDWLKKRGYVLKENRGLYSHLIEYQRKHIRVRIYEKDIIVLRDPGATLQITRLAPHSHGMQEYITPNQHQLNRFHTSIQRMCEVIENFEKRRAYTAEEARKYFWGEED